MDSDRFNEPSTSSIIRRIVTGWTANRTIPTPEREAPQSIVQTNRLWNEDSYNQRQTPLRGDRERQAVLLPKQMELTKPPAANAGTIIPGPVALEPSWKTPAPDPKHRNTGILESIPVQPLELRSRPVDRETVDCVHPPEELRLLFRARDFVTEDGFKIASCAVCGLAVTSPQPGLHEIANYYPAGYYGDPKNRRFPRVVESLQRALYTRRVQIVESVRKVEGGRVLDVGCGRGELLAAFRRRGWEVQGTELSDAAASYARQVEKVPVATGRLEDIAFPSDHFDAVTLWHVLEHVPNPRAMLSEVNRILKPGGVFLVGVPDFGGLEARAFRDKWFHLDVPRHVTHFTRATLKRELAQHGLEDRRWSGIAPEYDSFSFVQSGLNRIGLRHNLLYNMLRGKQAKVINAERVPKWQIAASVFLGAVLGLVSFPATVFAGLAGQGATMTVLAVKKGRE